MTALLLTGLEWCWPIVGPLPPVVQRIPVSLQHHQHLFLSDLFIRTILVSVKLYFFMVLICIYRWLMMGNMCSCVYQPVIYLLWRKVYSYPLPTFKLGGLFIIGLLWKQVPDEIHDLQVFSPIPWVIFSLSFMVSFKAQKLEILITSNLSVFFFWRSCFWCHM